MGEIEARVKFYETKLEGLGKIEALSGQKRVKAMFMLKEVEKGREILGINGANSSFENPPFTHSQKANQELRGGVSR